MADSAIKLHLHPRKRVGRSFHGALTTFERRPDGLARLSGSFTAEQALFRCSI